MALEQDASSRSENVHVSLRKRLARLESRALLKTGQQEKLYPPTNVSLSQQCRPQLLSGKFEILFTAFLEKKTQLWKLM